MPTSKAPQILHMCTPFHQNFVKSVGRKFQTENCQTSFAEAAANLKLFSNETTCKCLSMASFGVHVEVDVKIV